MLGVRVRALVRARSRPRRQPNARARPTLTRTHAHPQTHHVEELVLAEVVEREQAKAVELAHLRRGRERRAARVDAVKRHVDAGRAAGACWVSGECLERGGGGGLRAHTRARAHTLDGSCTPPPHTKTAAATLYSQGIFGGRARVVGRRAGAGAAVDRRGARRRVDAHGAVAPAAVVAREVVKLQQLEVALLCLCFFGGGGGREACLMARAAAAAGRCARTHTQKRIRHTPLLRHATH